MHKEFLNGRVTVKAGDIVSENVDAIVNAANSSLLGGSGVDGAIHRAAGPELRKECEEIRRSQFPDGLPVGQAVITKGHRLSAPHIIHTVGPQYGLNNGRDAELLADAYRNSLELAAANGLRSVAFPAISTGVYHFPKDAAARVASTAIKEFLAASDKIQQVVLVFFDLADAEIFLQHHEF